MSGRTGGSSGGDLVILKKRDEAKRAALRDRQQHCKQRKSAIVRAPSSDWGGIEVNDDADDEGEGEKVSIKVSLFLFITLSS